MCQAALAKMDVVLHNRIADAVVDNPKASDRALARQIGVNKTTVQRCRRILLAMGELPEGVRLPNGEPFTLRTGVLCLPCGCTRPK